MVRVLERRGPDGEGIHDWERARLGHRRLAIFDLSPAGHQPMLSPEGSVGIVFNGAIYNFKELRSNLQSSGYEFRTQTDTEVLIHGYREWGLENLVNKLRGMFAFGLWDDREQKLFLVRDRMGVKPLVYVVENGKIAFASSVRALRTAGFVSQLNKQALVEYLEFGFVTDDRTIYQGANKVPAASIVEWSNGNIKTTYQYWSPPTVNSACVSFEEAVEETQRLFLKAVEKRLYADVPVGALLSGGVDSSLVCWAIAELGGDITAYTIGTPFDSLDETADACATARQLGISHQVLEMSGTDEPDVAELTSAYAEPFACASALGMLRVSRAIASSATVLLTGDGGDDVFLGYPEHRHFLLVEKVARSLPGAVAKAWLASRKTFPRHGLLRRLASFFDYTAGGLAAVASNHDGLPAYRQSQILGERLLTATISQREMKWSLDSGRHLLSEFLKYDRRMRFVGEYMTKVDGATMHFGLEARSPFLDQELWEFAASLPFDLRLRGGRLKAILRELARRNIGDRVARGRKRGFNIPVRRWLAGHWRSSLEEVLRNSLLDSEGWINSRQALLNLEKCDNRSLIPQQLWYVFVLESWLRQERQSSKTKNLGDSIDINSNSTDREVDPVSNSKKHLLTTKASSQTLLNKM